MRRTEDPIAYAFSNPEAKRLLYLLEDKAPQPSEQARVVTEVAPETFRRITRRLAQFDLIRIRAPKGTEFESRRIRVVLELSPQGRRVVPVLHDLDEVLIENRNRVGEATIRKLSAVA